MLIFAPIALIADLTRGNPVIVFILAALGVIPLADLIGEATEELATHTGPRLGGLLNATLGNAAELIITIFAIRAGLLDLVLASITGSIIGNLLLVLGLSLLLGGLKNGIQSFDRRNASLNSTLLILAVVALMIPTFFDAAFDPTRVGEAARELAFSESVAVVMILLYGLAVYYSFRSHESPLQREPAVVHESRWSLRFSIGVLTAATLGTVFMSEVLVRSIESVTASFGLTEFFIGIIVIPLVGNVAEHLVAVEVAYKNDMELSLSVSLGSSLQIALFVAPILVFISLLFGQRLLLVFSGFEIIALAAASIIAAFIAHDGESNWLEGAMLLAVYFIIGIAFFFLPVVQTAH
jgi:Ca2+:H+ antiporter